jgi:hypothetical protein
VGLPRERLLAAVDQVDQVLVDVGPDHAMALAGELDRQG